MQGVSVLTLECGSSVSLTCIESVLSFSDTQIRLSTKDGQILLTGKGLKILSFSRESGTFCALGSVTGVRIMPKGESLGKRLFR